MQRRLLKSKILFKIMKNYQKIILQVGEIVKIHQIK